MEKATYEQVVSLLGENQIRRTEVDGKVWAIPLDPANSDYQAYLAWLENPQGQQSTPMVTDEASTL